MSAKYDSIGINYAELRRPDPRNEQKTPGLLEASYTALIEWALELGAKDMTEDPSGAMDAFRKAVGGAA